MTNKDITEDENFSRRMEENRRLRMEASRSDDLKAFTMAYGAGLCANPNFVLSLDHSADYQKHIAKLAIGLAEAALAELEKRELNKQTGGGA